MSRLRMRTTRTCLFLVALLALAVTAAPACASSAPADEASVQLTRRGSLDGSEAVVETFDVVEPMKTLRVEVGLSVDAGAVEWTLVDPDGDEVWSGSARARGEIEEVRLFDAVPGEWKLTLSPDSARGDWTIRWNGDDEE